MKGSGHEAAHEQIQKGEIDVEDARQRLLERYAPEEIDAIIQLYASAYGDSGLTAAEVLEEIVCDSMGRMNAFATDATERVAGEVGVFLRNVRKAAKDAGETKNTTGDGGGKYSRETNTARYDFSKPFSEQVEDYKNGVFPQNDTFLVGGTPDVFIKIGFNALPMTINRKHVDYALKNTRDADHFVGEANIKKLPEMVKKPVAVFVSKTQRATSVVALLPFETNGKQTVAPVMIDGFGVNNGIVIDSNAMTSLFGKTNAVTKLLYDAVQDEMTGKFSLLYWNKKEAMSLLQQQGLQLPGLLIPHDGFINSIRDQRSPVKPKMNNVTESQQFKRWFGDWKNHPENASKVVNDDGTPKVVYHGTNEDFTVFQSKTGTFWFSESMDYAEEMAYERGGKNVIQAYLSMKNPYIAKLPPNLFSNPNYEAAIIRKAKAGNYDGIILKNDTDNELMAETFYIVFDNTQIKSATDNIGTFDGRNPDIRYSREMDTVKALERQKKLLQEQRDYWKDQTRLTKTAKADKDAVRKLGREILREYSSSIKVDEILSDLQWLADDAISKGNASYQELTDAAEKIARKVLEGSGGTGVTLSNPSMIKNPATAQAVAGFLVGVAGFEPAASWTRTMRDTKLRHTPIALIL